MKKVVLTFGLIAGLIVTTLMLVSISMMGDGIINFENGELVGYTTMVLTLSPTIFFGIKSFRDNHNEGIITFGKAFRVGISIAGLAAIIYASGWEVYVNTSSTDFMESYTANYLTKMEKEGATTVEIEEMRESMNEMAEMYKNPIIRFGMTLMEILPVGVIITLICSGILRRKTATIVIQ